MQRTYYYGAIICVSLLFILLLLQSQIPSSSIIPQGSLQQKPLNLSNLTQQQRQQLNDSANVPDGNKLKTHLTKNDECKSGSPHQVILLTYGRSGSSLTSDIISEHPDVFFYYEPLHNLAKSFRPQQREHWRKTNRYLHVPDCMEFAVLPQLTNLWSCDVFWCPDCMELAALP
ncbi:hypothetical protein PoB_001301200 [Plakobranchus ocellatus]|uniref:Sulfotransferase domain-containing protein n=1 Tax=Plakobranchus ocellatus TaxID=259542 RepID=A0AAV3YU78_9GAST|nr:hypothetical protein PoB_001301200 [Plakobranchus ocellatus]